jgi:hypothetical protein
MLISRTLNVGPEKANRKSGAQVLRALILAALVAAG